MQLIVLKEERSWNCMQIVKTVEFDPIVRDFINTIYFVVWIYTEPSICVLMAL